MKPAQRSSTGSATGGLEWAAEADVASGVLQELAQRRRRRARRRLQLGAALGVMVLIGLFFIPGRNSNAVPVAEPQRATARLSIPERRVLPDGSVVELKEAAVIEIAYTDSTRRIVLTKGEAHFEVAKNPLRPFIVSAAGVEVRAVGTAFSVGLNPRSVEVLVTHGEVAIESCSAQVAAAPAGDATPATIVPSLTAGHRVVLGLGDANPVQAAAVEPISDAETSQLLAWRVPRLDFSATPLAEALPIFNGYSKVKVSLADRSLESLQISGIIRADNVESLLRLLESNYRVTAERSEDGIVLRAGR